jgi:hypothetical protein
MVGNAERNVRSDGTTVSSIPREIERVFYTLHWLTTLYSIVGVHCPQILGLVQRGKLNELACCYPSGAHSNPTELWSRMRWWLAEHCVDLLGGRSGVSNLQNFSGMMHRCGRRLVEGDVTPEHTAKSATTRLASMVSGIV